MFTSRRTALPVVLAAAGLLALPPASHAFRMIQNTSTGRVTQGTPVTCNASGGFVHWNIRQINWLHNVSGQGSGKAGALQAAMASWTNLFAADHSPTYAGTTTAGWSTDGLNTILWASGNGCTGNCLALTALVLTSGQVVVESDITFNSSYTWRTDGLDHDTQAVAAHEIGHSLGIHHTELTSTPRPTMYANYFGTDGRSLHSDDGAALQCSECRYCSATRFAALTGDGTVFGGRNLASLQWPCRTCLETANVDVFRDGVKIATTANSGGYTDWFFGSVSSANYWVCEQNSTTWYDSSTCSNVTTVEFTF